MKATAKSYILGFTLAALLTLSAFAMVINRSLSENALLVAVVALALTQLIVQLIFFLHLGRESKPKWNLYVFAFMLMVVFIVVAGSLWIMYNLNYNHEHNHQLSPTDSERYLKSDEGF